MASGSTMTSAPHSLAVRRQKDALIGYDWVYHDLRKRPSQTTLALRSLFAPAVL